MRANLILATGLHNANYGKFGERAGEGKQSGDQRPADVARFCQDCVARLNITSKYKVTTQS